ncbi:MAG: TIGR02281 family clan AA aspartic protease [Alphaproteobacteria bacterium]
MDRDEQWDLESLADEPVGGVLWPVLRNIGALIAICLFAVWAVFGVMGDSNGPKPMAKQAQVPMASEPGSPSAGGGYELTIPAGANGHFLVNAQANGRSVKFLVDTGASSVMLTEADARKVGIQPESLTYDLRVQTANGDIRAARATMRELRIDDLVVDDVEVLITRAPLSISLLGMSFLRRVGSYEARGDQLILRW